MLIDREIWLSLFVCIGTIFFFLRLMILNDRARKDYNDGWNDCYYIMTKRLEEENNEEDILKYLKKALTMILRDGDKYIRGDFKSINECRSVAELKEKVKEILER